MSRVISTALSLITPPASPPMDVAYAKLHIKGISSAEDQLIANWIEAARSYFEQYTGRQIMSAVWELWLDAFPDGRGRIELPKAPLINVLSVQYVDDTGTVVPFSDGASPETLSYTVRAPRGDYAPRGWIEPNYNIEWPTTRLESGSVRIQFTAGYSTVPETGGGSPASDVPALVTGILAYLIGAHDQFRSAVHQEEHGSIVEVPGIRIALDEFKYSALPTVQSRTTAWG